MELGPLRQDDFEGEINDRVRQPGLGPAATHGDVLLDHHVEELLAALDELARRRA